MDKNVLNRAADNIRVLAASMVEKAKSGHPGGAMGGADFVNVLYSSFLVTDPDNPTWIARDRFFLDPGHMSSMLYAVLALTGKYTVDELKEFRQWGSVTPGHPEVHPERGVENTSGPLGQGHVMAVGSAIAERFLQARFGDWIAHKTYAFISDGGIQEEISQGAGRLAGYLGLNNLIMFYDSNDIQLSTEVKAVTAEDTAAKYRAWNWNVIEVDGTDPLAMAGALETAIEEKHRPTIIIGKTVMGRGAVTAEGESYEGKCSTHGNPLSKSGASYEKTMEHLGADPKDPWHIWEDTKKLYADRAEVLRATVKLRHEEEKAWRAANPEQAALLDSYIAGKLPEIDWKAIAHKPNIATRQASADVLGELAKKVGNMIVASADLANSDKTDGFLKNTHALTHGDFSGAFLQAGVAELTMAAIMNGIALHGGCIAACGTFFVFSDYMKPAVRMAALMELPVKYIWTHDAFRVGEDGPTHEPVEQEAQIRLMEELRNFKGEPSMLVLRPGDAAETSVCWKMAMENTKTPTALILSRQDIPDLPAASGDRYNEALGAEKGGYVVVDAANPDVTLVANGSEVSLLVEVAKLLGAEGVTARVVSVPSIGLFEVQPQDYRDSVIPANGKVFGLTAGLPSTLRGVVGRNGEVFGLDHFGASAPYKVLDEKFGFTAPAVLAQVKAYLAK
ncbi:MULTISPECIES: transketolase [Muribaculum]|jgi:transketolase|uniref:transketolase n=16 Tax=Muribaculum TaxID=1918540 RepID=A0A4P7VL29_9BACT|nr:MULTISPECIES: transketolase [Muribaculum]ROT14893.1 transketolase [Muribaculaceae bacterium Isolate-102 (HZI)]THG44015.1 transketolase [Muribaculaceae bacterium]MCX4276979.1 transketolase [Muribaculum sp.]QCD36303.1 transketolase [Muribaculum gordoncarteri]TGY04665.1 transketolase [Muribaculum sp. NM65_B17]